MMEQFQLIAIAILSILWAISTHKWVRAEKKAKKLQQDKHGLQLDKLNLEREMAWLKNKDNDQQGTFVVEVNENIFLKEKCLPSNIDTGNYYDDIYFTFVELQRASIFRSLNEAVRYAQKCGGRVLHHKPNLEVVE